MDRIKILDKEYWDKTYQTNRTGWDISYASTPIVEYIGQLENKKIKILIPGCGNAYEGIFLIENGFVNTFLLDISPTVLKNFKKEQGVFPDDQIICGDFFNHEGQYDLIIEQTFFCALNPELREKYAKKVSELLKPGGKLLGVLFETLFAAEGPPFGGVKSEYLDIFKPYFNSLYIEPCYNSIKPRQGSEVFINLRK